MSQTQKPPLPYSVLAFTAALMLTALGALLWRAVFTLPNSLQPICLAALPALACGLLFGPVYGGLCGGAAALLGRYLLMATLPGSWVGPVLGLAWGIGGGLVWRACRRKPKWYVILLAAVGLQGVLSAAALWVTRGWAGVIGCAGYAAAVAGGIGLVLAGVLPLIPDDWLPAKWRKNQPTTTQ